MLDDVVSSLRLRSRIRSLPSLHLFSCKPVPQQMRNKCNEERYHLPEHRFGDLSVVAYWIPIAKTFKKEALLASANIFEGIQLQADVADDVLKKGTDCRHTGWL